MVIMERDSTIMPVAVNSTHERLRPIDIYHAMVKRQESGAKYPSVYDQYRRGLLSESEYNKARK